MADFASVVDVEARWRPLTSEERSVVETLLVDASDMIRVRFPDVDSRLLSGSLATQTVIRVVAGVVRRAMLNRDNDGLAQGSETVGPFARSVTYVNPSGNLYLSADDVRALEPAGYGVVVAMGWLA